MKTTHKYSLAVTAVLAVAALVAGCAQMPLEQQIAVKEPHSWDFAVKNAAGSTEYIRIYDGPDKVGFFKFEYGQKHPCNQGFQKTIKTTAPGLVQYLHDQDEKSLGCDITKRYIFRIDANGHPFEGWATNSNDREKKKLTELVGTVQYWDKNGIKPKFILVK